MYCLIEKYTSSEALLVGQGYDPQIFFEQFAKIQYMMFLKLGYS